MRIRHEDASIWWYHINMIGFHLDLLVHLQGWHLCMSLQKLSHMAFMFRVQMSNYHEGHACIRSKSIEEGVQCIQPACRRANTHDRESLGPICGFRGLFCFQFA